MDELDLAHLAGVVDSSALIRIQIYEDEGRSLDYGLQPVVRVSLKQSAETLAGKIDAYAEERGVLYSTSDRGTYLRLRITNATSIENFLEPLFPHLVDQVDEAAIMLNEVIPRVHDNEHNDRDGFFELVGYAEILRNNSNTNKESKYNQRYFKEEWGIGAT